MQMEIRQCLHGDLEEEEESYDDDDDDDDDEKALRKSKLR